MENRPSINNQEIISHNLKTLREYLGISQKNFSVEAKISTPTLSSYENGATFPSLDFLLYLKNTYNISIDKFVTNNMTVSDFSDALSQHLNTPNQSMNLHKYMGTYYLYYFGTGRKGDAHKEDSEKLLHRGIMTLYSSTAEKNDKLNVISCFNLKENAADKLFREITEISQRQHVKETTKITSIINKYMVQSETNIYTGKALFSPNNIFIHLSHTSRDHGLLILRNPSSEQNKYIGGIGCINSVSKGYSSDPCIQYIGLSRYVLSVSAEDISRELLLHSIDFDIRTETLEIIALFKKLYIEPESSLLFSEEQKSWFIQSTLEKHIEEIVNRNLFLNKKVSDSKDDAWYHFIKKYRKKGE